MHAPRRARAGKACPEINLEDRRGGRGWGSGTGETVGVWAAEKVACGRPVARAARAAAAEPPPPDTVCVVGL